MATVPPISDPLIAEYLDTIATYRSADWVAESRRYLVRLSAWLGGRPLVSVRSPEIAGFLATFSSLQASSRAKVFWILRAWGRWAHDQGYLPEDPTARLRAPRVRPGAIRVLTPGELQRLLEALRTGRWPLARATYTITAIIVSSASRVGAVLGLRAGDLVLEQVPAYALARTKGGGEQALLLLPWAVDVVRAYLAEHPAPGTRSRLFVGPSGRPITRELYWKELQKGADLAGIGPVHPHLLRHTVATWTLAQTRDLVLVQQLLGHTTLNSTRRYVHVAYRLSELADAHPLASWLSKPGIGPWNGTSLPQQL